MPDLRVTELSTAFRVSTNDNLLAIYLASLIRSITSLHDVINNRVNNRHLARQAVINAREAAEKQAKMRIEKAKQAAEEKKKEEASKK
jgi:26S proteasome regulatory subunit N8